ncbi:hypothetical protein ACFLQ2_04890, partial [archaeon]
VIENSAGDFLVAGIADNTVDNDMWVIKLNGSDGTALWNYTFDSGNGGDSAWEIIETTGGYVMAGVYNNGVDLDAWVLKIDASGGELWNYTYGCTGNDEARAIAELSTGGFAVAGYKNDATVDGWILKLDANGLL